MIEKWFPFSRLQWVLKKISMAAGFLFLFFFIVLPSPQFVRMLGASAERVEHFAPFFLFALCLLTFVTYVSSEVFKKVTTETSRALPRKRPLIHPRWYIVITVLAIVGIALRIMGQFNAPLHWEDHFHLSNVLVSPLERFNPLLRTEHHPLTNLAAFTSIKLLGLSKFSIKLPALIFTSLLLISLALFSRTSLTLFTAALVFLHLACNQISLWYMHSMRGYILAMLLTLLAYRIFWEAAQGSIPQNRNRKLAAWVFLCYACVLTHLFATLFCGLLVITLLTFLYLSRNSISKDQLRYGASLIRIFMILVVPVFLTVLFFQAMWLERLGDLFKGGFPDLSLSLQLAVGYSFSWPARALFLLVATLGVVSLSRPGPLKFSELFLMVVSLFFSIVLYLLQVRLIETRFILPFLIPFLIWVGETISEIPSRYLRWGAMGLSALLFGAVPIYSSSSIYNTLTLNVQNFDKFEKIIAQKTAPVSENCYTYSGEPNLIFFSQTLYLGKYQGVTSSESSCKAHYHIYFESPPDLPPIDTRKNGITAQYETIYDIDHQMTLFRRVDTTERLSAVINDAPDRI